MVPKTSFPPTFHHPQLTTTLSPSTALDDLSAFLKRTQHKPYLHPDSLLSSTAITYSAHSGPSGGLAIHHLRRIEAGLKGENLLAEDEDTFEAADQYQYIPEGNEELPAGDDSRLDALIRQDAQRAGQVTGKGGLKRKREIEEWAETSSQAGAPPDSLEEERDFQQREIESFANTPLHNSDWQDQEEYELEQRPLEGEVGDRDGAPVVHQNGVVPAVIQHDDDGTVKKSKKEKTDKGATYADKQARKEEKKARKMAQRLEKAEEAKKGKG